MRFQFHTLAMLILVPGLLVIVGGLALIGSRTVNQVIEFGMEQEFRQIQTLSTLIVDEQLNRAALGIESSVWSSGLALAVENNNKEKAEEDLNQVLVSGSGYVFDRLVTERGNDDAWIDLNIGLTAETFWDPRDREEACGSWGFQEKRVNGRSWYSLVYCAQIVSTSSGRILGRLHGGVLLNDNTPLLLKVSRATKVENLALVAESGIVAALDEMPSTAIEIKDIQPSGLSVRRIAPNVIATFPFSAPLTRAGGWVTPLQVVVVNQNPHAETLQKALIENGLWAGVMIIIIGGLMILCLHWVIRHSLGGLMQYVRGVEKRGGLLETPESFISEYHQLGLVIDNMVDSLRSSQKMLVSAKEEAEAASRSKSQFLASMSHELRTPLNAILGFCYLLKNELSGSLGNDKNREYVDDINTSGEHLLGLINRVLDLSKIEAGKMEANITETDIRPVFSECMEMLQVLAREKDLNLVLTLPDSLPSLMLDRQHLLQILVNLVSNAIKFTPPQGRVELMAHVERDRHVIIKVSDTGIGINTEDLPKVVEDFERGGNVLTRTESGTGLGLSLAKRLVELNGGTFKIDSRTREGTTVTLAFPVAAQENP